jgi:hypothetical protein
MKMQKLKWFALVGAAALGFSGLASAAYTNGNGATGSSLILNVFDTVTRESYSATLEITPNNLTYGTFAGGPTFTALAGNSTFTGLFSNNTPGNVLWNVVSNLNDAATGAVPGENIPWSLGFTAASQPAALGGNQMSAANLKLNSWVNLLSGQQTAPGSGLTTSTVATDAWNMTNAAAAFGGVSGGGSLPFNTTTTLGGTLSYFTATANGDTAVDPSTFAQIAGFWSLAGSGQLTWNAAQVGAVPVPAAAWLLGSGLLGLVGVGRRRVKKSTEA